MNSKHGTIWLLALLASGLLLGQAAMRHPQVQRQTQQSGQSLLNTVFGESRTVLSERMVYRADVYFHGGVGYEQCDHEHSHEQEPDEQEQGDSHEKHREQADHANSAPSGYSDWWTQLNRRLHPRGHKHLRGKREEKEILPWLWAAIRIDPKNPQPYVDAAYFLGNRLGQADEALELLNQGIRKNPEEMELYFAKGTTLYHLFDDQEQAFEVLERGRKQWRQQARQWQEKQAKGKAQNQEPPDPLLYLNLLEYMAKIAEDAGEVETAEQIYREALPLAPNDTRQDNLREKIEELAPEPTE